MIDPCSQKQSNMHRQEHKAHENVNTNSEEEQIWDGDVKLWFVVVVVVGSNGSCQLGATHTTCGWFATEFSTEFFCVLNLSHHVRTKTTRVRETMRRKRKCLSAKIVRALNAPERECVWAFLSIVCEYFIYTSDIFA